MSVLTARTSLTTLVRPMIVVYPLKVCTVNLFSPVTLAQGDSEKSNYLIFGHIFMSRKTCKLTVVGSIRTDKLGRMPSPSLYLVFSPNWRNNVSKYSGSRIKILVPYFNCVCDMLQILWLDTKRLIGPGKFTHVAKYTTYLARKGSAIWQKLINHFFSFSPR